MMHRISILKQKELVSYEKLLLEANSAMIYHSIPYLNLVSQILDTTYEIWGLFENNELVSACPWLIKEGRHGKVYNSLAYYGANGGIIAQSENHFKVFEEAMLKLLSEKSNAFAYTSSTLSENKLGSSEGLFIDERRAQLTPFPPLSGTIEEDVMLMCHSKNRNTIRKAFKENISFEQTNECKFLFETHKANMEAIGIQYKPLSFFGQIKLFFKYGEDYQIYEASIDGVKACAVLVFYFKNVVYYYTPAVLQEFRNKQTLSALIFHIMCKEIENGYKFWDWGGTPLSNEALYKFKKRWGTEDRAYFIQSAVYNTEILKASPTELSKEYPGMYVAPYELLGS